MIWIESVIEKHSHSRIEYMVKVGERRGWAPWRPKSGVGSAWNSQNLWWVMGIHYQAETVWPW